MQITDFAFGTKYTFSKWKHGESYSKVWIPLFARSSSGKEERKVRLLLRSTNVRNAAEVEKFCTRTTVGGMLINDLESLPSDHREQLKKCYPDTDFSNCLLVDEGREPVTLAGELLKRAGIAAGMFLFGLAALGASVSGKS